MFGMNDFIKELKNRNVALSSRFWVEIPLPAVLRLQNPDDANLVGLFCTYTNFPAIELAPTTVHVDGQAREHVVDRGWGNVSCIFACDENMVIKKFFDEWIGNVVVSPGGILAYPDEYTVDDLTIHQLNRKHESVYAVKLYRAFPKNMSQVALNSESKSYNQIQVDFSFKRWTSESSAEIASRIPEEIAGPIGKIPVPTALQGMGGSYQIMYENNASAPIDTEPHSGMNMISGEE